MNTVILAAGLFPTTDHALAHLRRAHFIACCDGAADACLAAGFTPDLIVGDGDSVSPAVRHRWADRLVINLDQETNDLTKALNLVPRIEAGTVWVNAHVLLDPAMPFGGVKQSGMGREFGRSVIEACTELKSVCIAH